MEYYIYDTASTLVTSLIPGQAQNVGISVSRACDDTLLEMLNSYLYSLSQADLAAALSAGNLHDDSSSPLLFTRRHPAQATLIVVVITALLAVVVSVLLNRSAKQRAAMQAQHNEQLREALEIAQDANASKTTFLSNMSHDIRTPMNAVIGFSITDKGPSSGAFERIEFQVADDGYGITEEFQKIIFDPFTRAENSTVNREVGTGLGLAITKDIIDLMGGSIELQSKEGEGSTFIVELPLRVPHEEQDEHFWEHHNVSRILLVDDEKNVCDGVRSNMADTGVEFIAVYSGEAAVELIEREYAANREYSAIILDWQMPGMNGLDTARKIRKIIPIDTPILFLTSYDWSSIETEALEIDVDGFLAKPFTTINLKEKLIEVEHSKNAVAKTDVDLDLKGLYFLIAEDNQLNSEILKEILVSEGASCDVAENGELAYEAFVSAPAHTYDAILMDVMMPVLNGYDATRKIRASSHPEAQSIPVIAMTANAFVKDVQDALDSGMNAHVAKPINMETLKNTLASCIHR